MSASFAGGICFCYTSANPGFFIVAANADPDIELLLKRAAGLLRQASYAVALTGAGISTPSGIPDFRSPECGLWERVDSMEIASLAGFRRRPQAFFEWVRPLARRILEAEPNPAHLAMARMEALGIIKALITQNIDILHSRAGSKVVYEIHGHLREATCVECFQNYPTDVFLIHFIQTGEVPRCPGCNGLLKPNVILFGEALPVKALQAAQRAARSCDVMLVAGSSLEVAPASELPRMALAYGAQLIIVNYERTHIDAEATVVIRDDVAETLPRLTEMLESKGRHEPLSPG
jgi:NAD-dependent deacetylase